MSRLPAIDPAHASGKVQELFTVVKKNLGIVPNLMRTFGNSPAVLDAYLGFGAALDHGLLPANTRERIALAVAQSNGCEYCLAAHTFIAGKVGLKADQIIAARQGRADDPKAGAAVALAVEIVSHRGRVQDAALAAARSAGLSDGEITEVVANVALNILTNYMNNVARTEIDFPAAADLTKVA